MTTQRTNKGQFPKGVSGNPSGRPAVLEQVRDLAREYTEEAVETLREIMRSKKAPAQARVAASSAILDRGWGKPLQATMTVPTDNISDFLDQMDGLTRGLPGAAKTAS